MTTASEPAAQPTMTFDKGRRERLRAALDAHRKAGRSRDETFEFDGHTFLAAYASYLLEYLDTTLPR